MADQKPNPETVKSQTKREDRLKAALKQNMARRKAQARARDGVKQAGQGDTDTSAKGAE